MGEGVKMADESDASFRTASGRPEVSQTIRRFYGLALGVIADLKIKRLRAEICDGFTHSSAEIRWPAIGYRAPRYEAHDGTEASGALYRGGACCSSASIFFCLFGRAEKRQARLRRPPQASLQIGLCSRRHLAAPQWVEREHLTLGVDYVDRMKLPED